MQDLFVNFPPNEIDCDNVQANGSEEEYQIYGEDSEDNYSDEWFLAFGVIKYTGMSIFVEVT